MKKNKAVFGLFLVLILTAFLCYTAAVGIGPTGTGSAKNIQTGLDLAGGVSITYQTKEKNPSAEDMADTVYKMQRRVEQYSTEAQAYKEGNNRITVEIPGATDADKILSDLGKPGSLCFITQSDTDDNENFSIGEERYVLARSLDEIRRSGSIVLEGSDVADAKGTAYQNSQNGTQYAVSLTLTDEGESENDLTYEKIQQEADAKGIAPAELAQEYEAAGKKISMDSTEEHSMDLLILYIADQNGITVTGGDIAEYKSSLLERGTYSEEELDKTLSERKLAHLALNRKVLALVAECAEN